MSGCDGGLKLAICYSVPIVVQAQPHRPNHSKSIRFLGWEKCKNSLTAIRELVETVRYLDFLQNAEENLGGQNVLAT